jgi:3-hydroxy-5-methyl-1-naphthoate 3-O-methyltransferase
LSAEPQASRVLSFGEIAALAGGHAEARAIQVALKLGLFEAIANAPRDEASLATAVRTEPRTTGLLANALAALGLLDKTDGHYVLGDSARRYLLRDSTEYLGGMILFDAELWDVWGHLEDSIRTGKPARTPDMFQTTPDDTARFIRAMDSLVRARGDAEWVAENLDLSRIGTIADLGGGPGTYIAAMLKRRPHLRAAIWDLPATLAVAREVLAEREPTVHDRIEMVSVDYLKDQLPTGMDAIFMSNIIHSENEATNASLMKKCFDALSPGGMLIVKDHIMNRELTSPAAGAVFALYLLLTTNGRDFSLDEVCSWMREAGFRDLEERVLPSPPFTSSIVIARKA